MSLVELEPQTFGAQFIIDQNLSVGVLAHDLEQLALLVVREAPLCPQVLLHAGECHVALLE